MIRGVRSGVGEAAPSPYDVAAGDEAHSLRQAQGLAAAVAAAPAAVVLVVLLFLVGPVVAVPAAVVLWGALGALVWRRGPAAVLGGLGATAADPVGHARLHNLTESLCVAAGLPKPSLFVVAEPAPNSLTVGLARPSACVVVTSGLLEQSSRMELEAVLAHELSHIRRGDMAVSTVVAGGLGPLFAVAPGLAGGLSRRLLEGREAAADVAAIGLTRYPPALVSALERMRDAPAPAARAPVVALLWNVVHAGPPGRSRPGPTGPADSAEGRIEALLEM